MGLRPKVRRGTVNSPKLRQLDGFYAALRFGRQLWSQVLFQPAPSTRSSPAPAQMARKRYPKRSLSRSRFKRRAAPEVDQLLEVVGLSIWTDRTERLTMAKATIILPPIHYSCRVVTAGALIEARAYLYHHSRVEP